MSKAVYWVHEHCEFYDIHAAIFSAAAFEAIERIGALQFGQELHGTSLQRLPCFRQP